MMGLVQIKVTSCLRKLVTSELDGKERTRRTGVKSTRVNVRVSELEHVCAM